MLGHLSWVVFFSFLFNIFFLPCILKTLMFLNVQCSEKVVTLIFVSSEICHFCDGRGGNKMGDTGEGGRKTIYN